MVSKPPVDVPSSGMRAKFCVRRSVLVAVVLLLLIATLLYAVAFSNWNVCNADLDDDVDALNAAAAAQRSSTDSRRQRPRKICLSPETESGLRVNMSIDSDSDLRRFNVSASASKPYTSIVHTIYTTSEIPSRWRDSARTWVAVNRDFAHCHWTWPELEAFVGAEYPWLASTYRGYRYFIQRCDVARYMFLYRYGGAYVDLDISCLTPLAGVFADAPDAAGAVFEPARPFGVATDFIAVRRPRDPVLRGVLSGLRRADASWWYLPLPYTTVMYRSGPVYLTRRVTCHRPRAQLHVIPWSKHPAYFGHVGGASWHSWDGWIIWRVYLVRHHLLRLLVIVTVLAVLVCVCRNRRSISNNWQNRFGLRSRTKDSAAD